MGLNNILENDGFGIAATGLSIVFIALVLIAVFISLLPKIVAPFSDLAQPESAHDMPLSKAAADEGEVLAAIGFALHQMDIRKDADE